MTLERSANIVVRTGDGLGGCPEGVDTILTFSQLDARALPMQLARNDDDDTEPDPFLCSRIFGDLGPGIYEVLVTGYNLQAVPAFVLSVEVGGTCGNDLLEVGEGCDDGNLNNGDGCDSECFSEIVFIRAPGQFPGSLPEAEADFYSFGLPLPAQTQLSIDDGEGLCPEGDPRFALYRGLEEGGWEEVARDDNSLGLCPALNLELEIGSYLLLVNGNTPVPDYILNADFFGTCGNAIHEIGEVCDEGRVEFGGGCSPYCGLDYSAGGLAQSRIELGQDLRLDFQLTEASRVVISTDDGEGCQIHDTFMGLFSLPDRLLLESDDDGGVGLCAQIQTDLEPGEYRVQIIAPSENNESGFELDVFLDFQN